MIYLKLAIIALTTFATWFATSDHYQKQIAEMQLETARAVQAELLEEQQKRKTAEENYAKNEDAVSALRSAAGRVSVHLPSCSALPEEDSTREDRDTRSGILSARVDEAFARLQAGAGDLFLQCDQLNIRAIKHNEEEQ